MALIKSIAIGKASGKIGNIIYQSYKGKTIIRQLNESISTDPTAPQLQKRNMFRNTASAWSFLSEFLAFTNGAHKPNISNYNHFVKTYFDLLPDSGDMTSSQLADSLNGTIRSKPKNVTISNVVYGGSGVEVTFRKTTLYNPISAVCFCLIFNESGSEYGTTSAIIEDSDWAAGSIILTDSPPEQTNVFVYIVTAGPLGCSEFYFQHS